MVKNRLLVHLAGPEAERRFTKAADATVWRAFSWEYFDDPPEEGEDLEKALITARILRHQIPIGWWERRPPEALEELERKQAALPRGEYEFDRWHAQFEDYWRYDLSQADRRFLNKAAREVSSLLVLHWTKVEALASRLENGGLMTFEEVNQLLRP
jgi:hypothetical protein